MNEVIEKTMSISSKRVAFLLESRAGILVEGYRDGKHMLSAICDGHPDQRTSSIRLAGVLGSDMVIVTADTYLAMDKYQDNETLSSLSNNYVRGSLAERFRKNDPNVSEAISVSICLLADNGEVMSRGGVTPYTRGHNNHIRFDVDKVMVDDGSGMNLGGGMLVDQAEESLRIGRVFGESADTLPIFREAVEALVDNETIKFVSIPSTIIEPLKGKLSWTNIDGQSFASKAGKSKDFEKFAEITNIFRD